MFRKEYWNLLTVLIFVVFIPISSAFAAACTGLPSIGNQSLSNCTLTVAGVIGSDQANNNEDSTTNTAALTLNSGAAVTINAGGVLAVGSVVLSGGTVAIATGGTINPNLPLYITDADGDGWASTILSGATIYSATGSGKRRLSLMRGTSADCGESTYSTTNQCCAANGAACASDGACCSAVCGTNIDGDSYFSAAAGHTGTCKASALAYTDCYDSNPSVYPGSAACSASHRGDGSFDWNCSGSGTACGTQYYAAQTYTYETRCCGANDSSCCMDCPTSCVGIGGGSACGTTGYLPGSYVNCSNGCGGWTTLIGTAGTQPCQ